MKYIYFMFLSHFSCFADKQVHQQGKIRLHTPKTNLRLPIKEEIYIFCIFGESFVGGQWCFNLQQWSQERRRTWLLSDPSTPLQSSPKPRGCPPGNNDHDDTGVTRVVLKSMETLIWVRSLCQRITKCPLLQCISGDSRGGILTRQNLPAYSLWIGTRRRRMPLFLQARSPR